MASLVDTTVETCVETNIIFMNDIINKCTIYTDTVNIKNQNQNEQKCRNVQRAWAQNPLKNYVI